MNSSPLQRRLPILWNGLLLLGALWLLLIASWAWRANLPLWHQGPDAPLGVFSFLGLPQSFSLQNCPPLETLAAALALALYTTTGCFALRIARLRCAWPVAASLALLIGTGVHGLLFLGLGMAHKLLPIPTALAWVVPPLLFAWIARRAGRSAQGATSGVDPCAPAALPWIPSTLPARIVFTLAAALLALLVALSFFHALFFPETYWDSLILYLGYGRMTWLEHGFPFKAVAQVGIGLGANYPHLYSTHGAAVAAVVGSWSEVPARLFAPTAALAATVLVFATALRLRRDPLLALICALAFRAMPYISAYSAYASDYALGLLFVAAFLYCALSYIQTREFSWLVVQVFATAMSMHLNYLMGVLWLAGIVTLLAAWCGVGARAAHTPDTRFTPGEFRRIAALVLVGIALAVPWYVRNWALTGNPVYSFFPGIFGGTRINPEVLKSAEEEWYANGDGVGRLVPLLRGLKTVPGAPGETPPDETGPRSAGERVGASWMYWVGFETFTKTADGPELHRGDWLSRLGVLLGSWRLPIETIPLDSRPGADGRPEVLPGTAVLLWPHAYKTAPFAPGLFFPSVLLAMLAALARAVGWLPRGVVAVRFGAVVGAVIALFLGYHYFIADLYLYQVLPVFAALSLAPALVWGAPTPPPTPPSGAGDSGLARRISQLARRTLILAVLLGAIVPGLAMAFMGFKFTSVRKIGGQLFAQTNLAAFRNPGMTPEKFLRLQYGEDIDAAAYINRELRGQRLLTHENRHALFGPDVELVHLDDWPLQRVYDAASSQQTMVVLRSLGLRYYYETPNEKRHRVNARLGLERWKGTPRLSLVRKFGENTLWEIHWEAEGLPSSPPNPLAPIESNYPGTP